MGANTSARDFRVVFTGLQSVRFVKWNDFVIRFVLRVRPNSFIIPSAICRRCSRCPPLYSWINGCKDARKEQVPRKCKFDSVERRRARRKAVPCNAAPWIKYARENHLGCAIKTTNGTVNSDERVAPYERPRAPRSCETSIRGFAAIHLASRNDNFRRDCGIRSTLLIFHFRRASREYTTRDDTSTWNVFRNRSDRVHYLLA